MKTLRLFQVICITCAILAAGPGPEAAKASMAGGWSPDERVPGYLDDTFTPFLLADQNRTVHAFANQWVGKGKSKQAIVYRRWTLAGGWTRPVDVILSTVIGDANFMWAFLDASDRMHVIFSASEYMKTAVYYTSAPAADADYAPAWSEPMYVGDNALGSGAIAGDDQGNLVILYNGTGDGNGVYAISSHDSGQSWSDPEYIFRTSSSSLVPYSIKTHVSESNRLHAVWMVTSSGVFESIHYAGLNMGSDQWDAPILLEQRTYAQGFFGPSYPIVVDNGTHVVVMYNSGNPFQGRPVDYGRPIIRVRLSKDDGKTWEDAINPFPLLQGNSGDHSLVVDSNNVVHSMVIMRIDSNIDGQYTAIGGLWYSELVGSTWSNPERLVPQIQAQSVHAVAVQGNVLLAVWQLDPGVGEEGVWYSYSVLDAPELPVIPLTSEVLTSPITQEVIPTVPEFGTLEPSPEPEQAVVAPAPIREYRPGLPILVGSVLVIIILTGAVIGYRLRNRGGGKGSS